MPLKRTPPSSPAVDTATTQNKTAPVPAPCVMLTVPALQHQLHHCSSEPSLTESTNISFRKRKRSLCEDEKLNTFMADMKKMFTQFKSDQEKLTEKLCTAVEDMRSTVDFMAQKFDALQARVVELETVRESDVLYIKTLEEKLETLECGTRSGCLEIRNVPVALTETKSSLLDTFLNTGRALNVPIEQNQVKDIFRIKSKDPSSRTIIVDLTSNLLKEKIITKYRTFNKGTSKLTSEHLRISGPARPIFISENLTSKMKRIFFLARDFAKVNDFKFCWVSHGKVFLRKRENGPLIRILNESDIKNICASK